MLCPSFDIGEEIRGFRSVISGKRKIQWRRLRCTVNVDRGKGWLWEDTRHSILLWFAFFDREWRTWLEHDRPITLDPGSTKRRYQFFLPHTSTTVLQRPSDTERDLKDNLSYFMSLRACRQRIAQWIQRAWHVSIVNTSHSLPWSVLPSAELLHFDWHPLTTFSHSLYWYSLYFELRYRE